MSKMFTISEYTETPTHKWFQWLLPLSNKKTYFGLGIFWPSVNNVQLPNGYNLYVLNFSLDAIDVDWVEQQAIRVKAPIVLISDNNYYSWNLPDNVHVYKWYSWHLQAKQTKIWWPNSVKKDIQYKASAHCNRISQNKLLVFTALAEIWKEDSCRLSLSTWLSDKNLSSQYTGNLTLDRIQKIFFNKYYGKTYSLDGFNRSKNYQQYHSNPWTDDYQKCAINFTNESFHYSHMQHKDKEFIYPGPFITEKTIKCLCGATGFVPVGQFDTLGTLERLGFKFNYEFDVSFDQIPQNFDRLEQIIKLIISLKDYTASELYEMTRDSAEYNQQLIDQGEFYRNCDKINQKTQKDILDKFID